MKLIQALPGMPKPITEEEVQGLLQSKLNMQLATIDEDGYPLIQPVWFLYYNEADKIFTGTQKTTKKLQSIRKNPNKIYFSIDDENFLHKGVKGRANAAISEDPKKTCQSLRR